MDDQLRCAHDSLFGAISSIDLTTDIVIVTADHGYTIGFTTDPVDEWSNDLTRDRFSAYTAISTPDDCESGLPEELSVAQILPMVLNCYGADLAVPPHRFMNGSQLYLGGIVATELAWDGWSTYEP